MSDPWGERVQQIDDLHLSELVAEGVPTFGPGALGLLAALFVASRLLRSCTVAE